MNRIPTQSRARKGLATALLAVIAGTGCATAAASTGGPAVGPLPPRPVSEADVLFMSGMIPHHAQAIVMADLADERSDSDDIKLLAERIIVSQRDEIIMMQQWLREHDQPVPAADATHLTMQHDGTTHEMLMPGMLTNEELAQLRAARGVAFDRLLLRFMIRHHEGAITMVDELFDSYGAAQDDRIYQFAADVFADQKSEIDRMSSMLAALGGD